ncbi:hypothetical protein V1478_004189 [Vespula squamosa]|uniref:Secreted protein n=1 Tax=Vespula squamosa TaxID=30214 RepID=A0ABD2BK30_VESSQ
MVRARKPLQLTYAKCCVVSLFTFTEASSLIVKTICVNKRVRQLVLNIHYTGILLLACRRKLKTQSSKHLSRLCSFRRLQQSTDT